MTPPPPRSRQDLQQETRAALVMAARAVFADAGYHGANLAGIAREAGFSKGAVYSNFTGKADLFLAVMDANMEAAVGEEGWDLDEGAADSGEGAADPGCEPLPEQFEEAIQGMALATLEFIAAAARDPHLRSALSERLASLIDRYSATARNVRPDEDDPLDPAERGALLAALDQGAALLMLGGSSLIDQQVLRAGMHRLLVPGDREEVRDGDRGAPALHDAAVRQRLAATAHVESWGGPTAPAPDPG